MLYRPERGAMWDPTLFRMPDGRIVMLSMHYKDDADGGTGMWLAVSEDGVHFTGVGRVLENPGGLFKMYINRTFDGRYCVNFGSTATENDPHSHNDTMKFAVSDDLVHWEIVDVTHPDGRWYTESGRWDHMYVTRDGSRFVGAIVATPKTRPENGTPDTRTGCFGLLESRDGIRFTQLPAPEIEWGDIPPINCLEGGGIEKIGDKWYYIGGFVGYAGSNGYNLYTFVADRPEGPYRPDREAFRLCGFDRMEGKVFIENLAAFCRDGDRVLVSNAVMAGGRDDVWLLPLRSVIADEAGHIHLGWWEGNAALYGDRLPAGWRLLSANDRPGHLAEGEARVWTPSAFEAGEGTLCIRPKVPTGPTVTDASVLALLDRTFAPTEGMILEGRLTARSAPAYDPAARKTHCWRTARVGFFIEENGSDEAAGQGLGITLDVGHPYKRRSNVMHMEWNGERETGGRCTLSILDEIGEDSACLRGISAEETHTFRFLFRLNVIQLYVDDRFVQTFVSDRGPTGRVGILAQNAEVRLSDVRLFTMSVPDVPHERFMD